MLAEIEGGVRRGVRRARTNTGYVWRPHRRRLWCFGVYDRSDRGGMVSEEAMRAANALPIIQDGRPSATEVGLVACTKIKPLSCTQFLKFLPRWISMSRPEYSAPAANMYMNTEEHNTSQR